MVDVKIIFETALQILMTEVEMDVNMINAVIKSKINQNQFDSLIAFSYNIGRNGFKSSTVLKRVNHNPNDPLIKDAFRMWVKDQDPKTGKLVTVKGLVNRREKEITLYFKPIETT